MMEPRVTMETFITSSIVVFLWIFPEGSSINVPCGATNCTDTDNAWCRDGFCECQPGFKDIGDLCRPRMINDSCSDSSDCSQIPRSLCLNDICQCLPGFASDENNSTCRARKLNDSCKIDSDCSSSVANSRCNSSGMCTCFIGYMPDKDVCVRRRLNDSCEHRRDCIEVMNNTQCLRRMCMCARFYIEDGDDGCRMRRLGDSCSRSVECNIASPEVRVCKEGKCSCDKGYRQIRDNSCEKITLGSPCGKTADCLSIIPRSKCLNKTCRCDTRLGYKNGSDNTTCEVRELGDACTMDEECQNIANSACTGGVCSCLIGHRENKEENDTKSSCKLNVIGDRCKSKQDCMLNNSACVRNTCSCVRGFTSVNGSECRLKTLQETACSKHRECMEFFNNSVCNRSGRCECRRQYAEQDDGLRCQFRYLGDSCVDDSNCLYSVEKSECWNSVCRCLSTHLASADNTSCQIKMIGGDKCSDNATCSATVPHSFCDISANDTCQCGVGYYRNENFNACLEKRLKDTCAFDEECTTTNTDSFCSPETGKCECIPGFIETFLNGSDLRPSSSVPLKPFCAKRRIGEQSCEGSTDCSAAIANSTCGVCSDAPDTSPCRRQCAAPDSDNTDLRHLLSIHNSTSCAVRACTCNKGFVTSIDRTRCEGRKLREPCSDDEDCSVTVPDAMCMETRRVCFCRHGYREAGPDVCTRRIIGDHCTEQIDCESAVPFSSCNFGNMNNKRNGECVCKSGYHAIDNNTKCRKRQIGDRTCTIDTDCSDAVNNSYCHRGMCVCERGHSSSPDHKNCRKRRLHVDYCETTLDCTPAVNNSVCEKHRCVCVSGYYSRGEDECVQRQIGDKNCRIDSDCFDAVNNSECMSGTCTCVSGFIATDANVCQKRKLFDGICSSHVDCSDAVEHSLCHNSSCVCVTGFYPSTDRTACHQRRLNDSCSTTLDCSSAIRNSKCSNGQCVCIDDHDPHENNSLCVKSPKMIGQPCYSAEQCQKIDNRSYCDDTRGRISVCDCPEGTFVAQNRSTCVLLPAAIGDHCLTDQHCTHKLTSTFCGRFVRTCRCLRGYFVDNLGVTCHREPRELGDACQKDDHCIRIAWSKCEPENSTCVCKNGFKRNNSTSCVERPRLPEFKPLSAPNVPVHTKDGSRDGKCYDARSHCSQLSPSCCCEYRHARPYNSSQCVPIQTYTLVLHLQQEAGLYDYVPLHFHQDYMVLNETSSQMLADKITLTGLMAIFTSPNSSLRERYVASEVTGFTNPSGSNETTDQGVNARVLLHLKADYYDATPISDLYGFMAGSLSMSDGILGDSMLKVALPFRDSVVFTDYDECATKTTNDCSDHSTCINTLGSFMCVCFSSHDDLSKSQNKQLGRLCVIRTTTDDNSAVCSSDNCENNWHFVGLAVALFLLTVMIFIVYEIIQRKQTFTARKLYEKFGTTKIRKLRQASMKRMQERKKRKQEETKRQKEEEKQKKEELKRQKSEEKRLKEEEKKQQDMAKKNLKKAKRKRKHKDEVEWVEEPAEDAGRASPVEFIHQSSSPFSVSIEENVEDDQNSLPDEEEEDTLEEVEINTEIVSDLPESPV